MTHPHEIMETFVSWGKIFQRAKSGVSPALLSAALLSDYNPSDGLNWM
jgi:hypothetical protein